MGAGGDPFRRVRPGEAVRLTATAWNALMDLLRTSRSPQGGGTTAPELPATVERFSSIGHQCVMGEAVLIPFDALSSQAPSLATTPLSTGMTFSTVEKRLWGGYFRGILPLTPNDSNRSPDDAIAICIDPLRCRFAISGMAWVRVRRLRRWHRYARRCIALPTDDSTQLAAVAGCLDSCGWGPAEILGYAASDTQPVAINYQGEITNALGQNSFTAGSICWALVRF